MELRWFVLARRALSAAACAAAVLVAGCNTTEGVGKDIKAAGSGIERAADRAND